MRSVGFGARNPRDAEAARERADQENMVLGDAGCPSQPNDVRRCPAARESGEEGRSSSGALLIRAGAVGSPASPGTSLSAVSTSIKSGKARRWGICRC